MSIDQLCCAGENWGLENSLHGPVKALAAATLACCYCLPPLSLLLLRRLLLPHEFHGLVIGKHLCSSKPQYMGWMGVA